MRGSKNSRRRRTAGKAKIRAYYRALSEAWGPQHWWPAHTPFEVIVGAFLTQNTAWTNVERALANLRAANLLSQDGIRHVPLPQLESLIRPSGYFRQKAGHLKSFIAFLDRQYGGSLDRLVAQPTNRLREELLALKGVGPETADSILLYAGNHPVFVVDTYARRILERHRILPEKANYDEIRQLFEQSLAPLADAQPSASASSAPPLEADYGGAAHSPSAMSAAARTPLAQIYNEMHGLIVGVGKHYCKKAKAECDGCPLKTFVPPGKLPSDSSHSGHVRRAR